MGKKRTGTLSYRVKARTWTVRESDSIRLAAFARGLSRVFRQDVNESMTVRHLLEKLPAPDPDVDPDLFGAFLKAIEAEGGTQAIVFPTQKEKKEGGRER